MIRFFAGAALCLCTALVPFSVLADESAPDYRTPAITLPVLQAPPPAHRSRLLRPLLYALQAFDAVQTSNALKKRGRYESNGMVRPFVGGGAPTIFAAFVVGDLLRDKIFAKARPAQRDALDVMQALSNIDGIVTTSHALHAP
jgi:hypothetical protein